MNMKLSVFLVILALFSSCVDFKKSEQLELIDALSLKLSEIQEIKSGSIDSVQSYMAKVVGLDSLLKHSYQNDTLSFYDAENIDLFINLKVVLPDLNTAMVEIDSVIMIKSNSIERLRKDVENSTGVRSKYPEFIAFEKEEILKIKNQLIENQLLLIELMEAFNSLFPKLNDYLSSFVKGEIIIE
ncbi:MAG: hypothetical protein QNK85_04685 [Crocinitomicaceae bacterium]